MAAYSVYLQVRLLSKHSTEVHSPLDEQRQTLSLRGNHQPLGSMQEDNGAECPHGQTGYYLSLNTP